MANKFAESYRSVQSALQSESDSSDSDSSDDVWKRKSSRKRVVSKSPVKTVDTKLPLSTDENGSCTLKKRKLNTVWCNVLQEQTVADDLVQFGLKPKPVSYQDRSCESYDFRLGATDTRGKGEHSAMEDESPHSEDIFDKTKLDEDSNENSDNKNSSRCLWPKSVRESKDVVDKVAKKIIRVLNEPKHHIIYKVVQVLGSKRALELLEETEKIEDNGGMFVVDNSRRRTPGGTFLQLLKKETSVSNKKKNIIFAEDRRMYGKTMKRHGKHSKKRRKKNHLESMDIVFEPADGKSVEETVEQNDSNETGSNDSNGTVSNESNGKEAQGVENNACAKEDSELEEGEITD